MLAYFKYFLGCSWLCLNETREVKVIESDLAVSSIEVTFTCNAFVWNVLVEIASAEGICIDARLFGISSWFSNNKALLMYF